MEAHLPPLSFAVTLGDAGRRTTTQSVSWRIAPALPDMTSAALEGGRGRRCPCAVRHTGRARHHLRRALVDSLLSRSRSLPPGALERAATPGLTHGAVHVVNCCRGRSSALRTPTNESCPAVCCSAWFGLPLMCGVHYFNAADLSANSLSVATVRSGRWASGNGCWPGRPTNAAPPRKARLGHLVAFAVHARRTNSGRSSDT